MHAAVKGNPDAMYRVGRRYAGLNQQGVAKNSKEALRWLHRAAKAGQADAMARLGFVYFYGKRQQIEGVKKNYQKSTKWYRAAAKLGHVRSVIDLGDAYRGGYGVKQNFGEALRLYQKANAKGHFAAPYYIALHYDKGEGVQKSSSKAAQYFMMAYGKGYPARTEKDKKIKVIATFSFATKKSIQRELQKLGYYSGKIDGRMERSSARALEAFYEAEREKRKKATKAKSKEAPFREIDDIRKLEKLD